MNDINCDGLKTSIQINKKDVALILTEDLEVSTYIPDFCDDDGADAAYLVTIIAILLKINDNDFNNLLLEKATMLINKGVDV